MNGVDGGAYITLAAGDAAMGGTLAANLSKCAEVDVFTLDYRLAPDSRFPSQVFEVLSAYRHLQSLGYDRIFLGGDSAGANLVLAFWRYADLILGERQSIAGLLLNSVSCSLSFASLCRLDEPMLKLHEKPWLDLAGYDTAAFQQAATRDLVARYFVETGSKALGIANLHDPFASPIVWSDADLAALPSLYVIHGGDETLLDEGTRFVERAQAQGIDVTHAVYVSLYFSHLPLQGAPFTDLTDDGNNPGRVPARLFLSPVLRRHEQADLPCSQDMVPPCRGIALPLLSLSSFSFFVQM